MCQKESWGAINRCDILVPEMIGNGFSRNENARQNVSNAECGLQM